MQYDSMSKKESESKDENRHSDSQDHSMIVEVLHDFAFLDGIRYGSTAKAFRHLGMTVQGLAAYSITMQICLFPHLLFQR